MDRKPWDNSTKVDPKAETTSRTDDDPNAFSNLTQSSLKPSTSNPLQPSGSSTFAKLQDSNLLTRGFKTTEEITREGRKE